MVWKWRLQGTEQALNSLKHAKDTLTAKLSGGFWEYFGEKKWTCYWKLDRTWSFVAVLTTFLWRSTHLLVKVSPARRWLPSLLHACGHCYHNKPAGRRLQSPWGDELTQASWGCECPEVALSKTQLGWQQSSTSIQLWARRVALNFIQKTHCQFGIQVLNCSAVAVWTVNALCSTRGHGFWPGNKASTAYHAECLFIVKSTNQSINKRIYPSIHFFINCYDMLH